MNNKEKSAELFRKYEYVIRCPICHCPMEVIDLKSLACEKKHTFDFAKQGYVNMLTRSTNSHYNKNLFKTRRQVILESELYVPLHEKISEVMKENLNASNGVNMILDAGCGEGSHLQSILDNKCEKETMLGMGFDISKEGIRMAASNFKESIWLVGDVANIPFATQSFHCLLNILSPANYKEFRRILVPNGLVVKVVPRTHYLKELREALFDDSDKKIYKNDEIVLLFKEHFTLVDVFQLCYTKELNQTELMNLAQMTPLTWNANKKKIERFTNQVFSEITIDLDILVGINKPKKGGDE